MAHTYTKLRATKNHSILHGLHSDIFLDLIHADMNGNIKGITIKDAGFPNEEVIVTMTYGDKYKFVHEDGHWKKKEIARKK